MSQEVKVDDRQRIMDIAAQVMDEQCPDWFDRIDFTNLDMMYSDRCIAGQCGLIWFHPLDELQKRIQSEELIYVIAPFASSNSVPYWERAVMERKYPKDMEIGKPEKEYTIEPAEPIPGIKESPSPTPEPRKEPAKPEREKVPA